MVLITVGKFPCRTPNNILPYNYKGGDSKYTMNGLDEGVTLPRLMEAWFKVAMLTCRKPLGPTPNLRRGSWERS